MISIKNEEKYIDYMLEVTTGLLAVDSPSGYTDRAAEFVMEELRKLGYEPEQTRKGGVMVCLNKGSGDGLLLEAHMDTLGAMVTEVKANGQLHLTNIGGMNANNAEGENCKVITRFSGSYEGTVQLMNASLHVNDDYKTKERNWDTVEMVLDAPVHTKEETQKLGICPGDIVCFEPRTRITERGYIKSRFLDDKLSVGILLGYANYLTKEEKKPERSIYAHITVYEEVGHGGSASVPQDVTEAISVDMGCVGDGLTCREEQVSICAKDSMGPYDYQVVNRLIQAAKETGADYAVDIYPHYGSDVEATLRAGYDIRHGLIGPGVYASHGYERSHKDGMKNTWKVLIGYTLG